MTDLQFFKIEAESADGDGAARTGELRTARGVVKTPVFMPVGTQGSVKSVHPRELGDLGAEIILGNTYHLSLRPGAELVRKFGGLAEFARWPGPILTDSGGYQVFSLAKRREISEQGVVFQSHLDGARLELSPEAAMRAQDDIGSDIAMVLDECPPHTCSVEETKSSAELTVRWARRSLEWTREKGTLGGAQKVFGIAQGGLCQELRKNCAEEIAAMDFDGCAVGGLSVGERPEKMLSAAGWALDVLPREKPRYAMGVGEPTQMLELIGMGADMFDCVLPTRLARHGTFYTTHGPRNIRNAVFREDEEQLDARTPTLCEGFSRGYLRHLTIAGEILGLRLLSLHNLAFLLDLMRDARVAIGAGRYAEFKNDFIARYRSSENH